MAFFKANYRNGIYIVALKNLSSDSDLIVAAFDTGAVNTVISLEEFMTDEIDKEHFVSELDRKTSSKIFRSASGNEMKGYPVCAEDVVIAGITIPKFYYYLIVDTDAAVGLVGNDFISKCKFWHNVDGDIEVAEFDFAGYDAEFVRSAVSGKEIERLVDICSINKAVN